ncbi:RHS domain-containing protein [Undibacterium jejuense]|uniref:RHS domain-containing protein n=1 Tax=Undibacterium jejuense TaxID=1344949 RepID=A0A923HFE2_9BURK|nr:RHS domain-containing protein [Undibacterium jejuense]
MTGILFIKTKNSSGQDTIAYYHNDHLQTPMQATDKAGNIVWSASYTPFGRATVTTPAVTTDKATITSKLRFPGQYEDQETGLHYNYNRYYDPQTGRYVTSDPIGLNGGINTYAYVGGNPVSGTDPSELEMCLYRNENGSCAGWADMPAIPQPVVNAAAGFGDGVSLGMTSLIREIMGTNDAVDFSSREYWGGVGAGIVVNAIGIKSGGEIGIDKNIIIAPWGNRTGNKYGEWPHYHRRGSPDGNGKTPQVQGIGRHRPWEKKSPDKNWCDRF